MTSLRLDETLTLGEDRARGNLLAVQPWMTLDDYASADAFYAKLHVYLEAAFTLGWLNERSIAVFPEYTGTWLVAAGEGKGVFRAKGLQAAMTSLALAHPLSLARSLSVSHEQDRLAASLFRTKAVQMASAYSAVFSRLAREYHLTILAGSILLPDPEVVGAEIRPVQGPLQNVSALFAPDGLPYLNLVRKCFPIQDELPFLQPAQLSQLPVYETPAGRLGVLVCADSWFPPAYTALKAHSIQLLAVPSYINHTGAWDRPWGGYSGWTAPADVDPADIGRLTEGQAWRKYALAGRLAESGARCGVNVFLQGSLWDLGSDGRSIILSGDQSVEASQPRSALLNLWL